MKIVTPTFNKFRHINVWCNLKEEKPSLARDTNLRSGNVVFVQNIVLWNHFDLERGDILLLKMMRNIELDEGLFGTNGSYFIFKEPNYLSKDWRMPMIVEKDQFQLYSIL